MTMPSVTRKRYEQMGWPQGPLPPLTGPEAASAAKRLYRLILKRPVNAIRLTSGNRRTYARQGALYVNPDQGWRDFVHDLSHYLHGKKHPSETGHGWHHARIEKEMIDYVVRSGWLDGKLKRAPKPKPNKVDQRYQQTLDGIARWETKLKRAQTALKKLRARRKYYETRAPLTKPLDGAD
jgi:hypothetical protein